MCLLWVWKPRAPSARLHDPISAILTAVLPEAIGGVAAAAPEIAAATIPEIALPEVAVSALAPEAFAAGDIAAAALPALGAVGAGLAPELIAGGAIPGIVGAGEGALSGAIGLGGDAGFETGTYGGVVTPQGEVVEISPSGLNQQAIAKQSFINQAMGMDPATAQQQAAESVLEQEGGQGLKISTPAGSFNAQQIESVGGQVGFDPVTGNLTITAPLTDADQAALQAAQTVPLAPTDTQVALPPVDVAAAPVEPPLQPPPTTFASILNAINPIGSAQAAEAGLPPLSAAGSTAALLGQVGNVETLLGGGTVPAQPSVNLPNITGDTTSTPGAGSGGAGSSQLTPGGALTNIAGITPTPAAPGQAPPELSSIDTSGATAGTASAPPSATGPATSAVDTSAAPPSGGSVASPATTTTPTGSVGGDVGSATGTAGTPAAPLDTSTQAGASDVGGTGKAAASGGLLSDAKSWLKENSGLLSLLGTVGGLGMSLFNKPNFPTQSAALQATQPGLGTTQQAFGNAVGAQAPANQAFKTAAGSVVPAAEQGIAQTVQTEAPLAKTQADLSTQLASTAQPLLSAATTGVLPPGEADAIQSALDASRATIEGTYGNLNLAGSTTEAQDIAAAAGNIRAQIPGILNQLVTQGIQETQASTGAAGATSTANSTILNAIQGLTQALNAETGAAGGVTSAASGVTGAANAVTSAGEAASNANLQVAQLQLQADQELQQALAQLGRNLALSQISPSTINVTG